MASDAALAVLGSDGRLLAQWSSGSLPGLTGRILAIAVVGPERLPAAQAGRSWEVVRRLETYKSGAPLAGLAIELCSARGRDGSCAGGTSVALQATTQADGSGSSLISSACSGLSLSMPPVDFLLPRAMPGPAC